MTEQEAAVEHLSRLLERDHLSVDEYRGRVDQVLATTTEVELATVLGDLALPAGPPLVITISPLREDRTDATRRAVRGVG